MNQQTLMASFSAYPAPKASDVLLWQVLSRTWPNEEPVQHGNIQESLDDDMTRTQSVMTARLEKILLTTRHSWAKR